jgi:hypothetical protein
LRGAAVASCSAGGGAAAGVQEGEHQLASRTVCMMSLTLHA